MAQCHKYTNAPDNIPAHSLPNAEPSMLASNDDDPSLKKTALTDSCIFQSKTPPTVQYNLSVVDHLR